MRWVWLSYWAFLTTVTLVPVPDDIPVAVAKSDKVMHFVLYAVLTLLGGHVVRKIRLSSYGLLAWGAGYIAFGALNEWLQGFVGRTPSVDDLLADAGGVAVATLWLVWKRR